MGLSVTVLYFRQIAAGVHSSSIVTDRYADLPLLRLHRAHNLFRPPEVLNEPFELLKKKGKQNGLSLCLDMFLRTGAQEWRKEITTMRAVVKMVQRYAKCSELPELLSIYLATLAGKDRHV